MGILNQLEFVPGTMSENLGFSVGLSKIIVFAHSAWVPWVRPLNHPNKKIKIKCFTIPQKNPDPPRSSPGQSQVPLNYPFIYKPQNKNVFVADHF